MNRETIEKAALLFAGAGEWGECPYNPDAKNGFMAGAYWRINSVWHDCQKELPAPDETVIVEYIIDGERDCAFTHRTENPKVITDKHGFCFYIQDAEIIRWAYVSDLLPDRKEAQP